MSKFTVGYFFQVLCVVTSLILLDIHSEAKVVLVVEKDATFQRLLDDGVLRRLKPCILVTVSKVQNITLLTDVCVG